jgi:hypothetical protein
MYPATLKIAIETGDTLPAVKFEAEELPRASKLLVLGRSSS